MNHPTPAIEELATRITPRADDVIGRRAADEATARWATRAKPPGSLGLLEDTAITLAAISGCCPPDVPTRPAVLVFGGDHGVVADGASAWPSEVTAAMVATMRDGRAAINAFAATVGATVTVVDVGLATDLDMLDGIVHANVRRGTGSIASEPAMTEAEARAAVRVGASVALDAIAGGADLIVGGDMGIGNTTPSAALIAHWTGASPADVVGPGAGLPMDQLCHKRDLVAAALARARTETDPVAVLASLGGLEIAALAGAYLAAASRRVPVLLDGVIAGAAAVAAAAIAPALPDRLIAGHRSTEPAATRALEHLGLVPLLDLDLRLGEGTGACLAVPLVQAAARALRDMADLPT